MKTHSEMSSANACEYIFLYTWINHIGCCIHAGPAPQNKAKSLRIVGSYSMDNVTHVNTETTISY